jgi:ABC-2 type transport system permease protein
MMILLYGQNVMRSVLEEKTTRVAEVVISSIRPDVLMAGKVLGVGASGWCSSSSGSAARVHRANVAPCLARGQRTGLAAQTAEAADATAASACRRSASAPWRGARLLRPRLPALRRAVRGRRGDGQLRAGAQQAAFP